MLSEEEKKAIKYFKNRLKDVQTNYTSMYYKVDNLEILLNLIEKQQAEIERLKYLITNATEIIDEYANETEKDTKKLIEYQDKIKELEEN